MLLARSHARARVAVPRSLSASAPMSTAPTLTSAPRVPLRLRLRTRTPTLRALASSASASPSPSDPGPGTEDAPPSRLARALNAASTVLLTRNGALAGTTILALVMGRVAYDTMEAFIHLDFFTVAELGFVTGAVGALSTVGVAGLAYRATSISPEAVLRESFALAKQSPGVLDMMGATSIASTRLRTGVFRAYTRDGGSFGTRRDTNTVGWVPPRLQLTYQIYGGSDKQSVVTVEAHKSAWGSLVVDFVAVDLLRPDSDVPERTVIVVGDEKRFHVRDDLRTYVSLNRRYVKSLPQKAFPDKLA